VKWQAKRGSGHSASYPKFVRMLCNFVLVKSDDSCDSERFFKTLRASNQKPKT
jgi:hypothetical protein